MSLQVTRHAKWLFTLGAAVGVIASVNFKWCRRLVISRKSNRVDFCALCFFLQQRNCNVFLLKFNRANFLVCLKSKINMFYRLIKRAQNVLLCGFSLCVCNVEKCPTVHIIFYTENKKNLFLLDVLLSCARAEVY